MTELQKKRRNPGMNYSEYPKYAIGFIPGVSASFFRFLSEIAHNIGSEPLGVQTAERKQFKFRFWFKSFFLCGETLSVSLR